MTTAQAIIAGRIRYDDSTTLEWDARSRGWFARRVQSEGTRFTPVFTNLEALIRRLNGWDGAFTAT